MSAGANGPLPGGPGHRRAKSSIGVNRKVSGKAKDGSQKHPPGPLQGNGIQGGKKSSSSQNRAAMLSQLREKNSSSAMA